MERIQVRTLKIRILLSIPFHSTVDLWNWNGTTSKQESQNPHVHSFVTALNSTLYNFSKPPLSIYPDTFRRASIIPEFHGGILELEWNEFKTGITESPPPQLCYPPT